MNINLHGLTIIKVYNRNNLAVYYKNDRVKFWAVLISKSDIMIKSIIFSFKKPTDQKCLLFKSPKTWKPLSLSSVKDLDLLSTPLKRNPYLS